MRCGLFSGPWPIRHVIYSLVSASIGALVCVSLADMAVAQETARSIRVASGRQPQVAVGGDGSIYVAFGVGQNIYCALSEDRGKRFGDPRKVGEIPKLALGARRGPRIAAASNAVVVTAIGHEDGDVLAWRSENRGATWQGPIHVNDARESAREGLHAMAAAPKGRFFCAWLDLRNGKTEIFGTSSVDGGKTWAQNQQIYRSPSGTVCECCHPSVAFGPDGKLHVMFRNYLDGNRDMYLASSSDDGESFEEAAKLGVGNWLLEACPMDGGALAALRGGKVTTVWRRNRQVLHADPNANERLLGHGQQPWAVGTQTGAYIVWLSRRPGDLWLLGPGQRSAVRIAKAASDPVLGAASDGKGPVVLVWESGPPDEPTIMSAIVPRDS